MIDSVSRERMVPTVPVDIQDVALVDVRRDGHAYKWSTLTRIPLGPPPANV